MRPPASSSSSRPTRASSAIESACAHLPVSRPYARAVAGTVFSGVAGLDGARFDVAVVGGGIAGVSAALAAADRGARTLILEAAEALGGNATAAFVHTLCGLYEA